MEFKHNLWSKEVTSMKFSDVFSSLLGLNPKQETSGDLPMIGSQPKYQESKLSPEMESYMLGMQEKISNIPEDGDKRMYEVNTSIALDPKEYVDVVKPLEGFHGKATRLKKYNPRTGKYEFEEYLTLGHGDYGEHIKEGDTITEEEAEPKLLENIAKRLPVIEKNIKGFDSMPKYLRDNIVGSWFRGGLSGSPKTIGLMNEGKFEEASKEFLKNDEYFDVVEEVKRAKKLGIKTEKGGVKTRMENMANALKDYAEQLKNTPSE